MKEAWFWESLTNKMVQCKLCYRYCKIPNNLHGACRIRKNIDGKLYLAVYGKAAAINIDPIEKKPFFHFYPGSKSFSFGTWGCNFFCLYCQNWDISQAKLGKLIEVSEYDLSPEKAVKLAKQYDCMGMSYTYNEPTIFFEYAYDTGILAHKQGLYNNFVSNGSATPEAVKKAKEFLDAVKIDLKGEEEHYKKISMGIPLENVLECIKNYFKTDMHLEIVTLVIPDDNDNKDFVVRMSDFLKKLNPFIPWHFTQFHPDYKMLDRPVTPVETLEKMHDYAKEEGMQYVYVGNVLGHPMENTYCHNCNELLIERYGFSITKTNLDTKNFPKCPKCRKRIPIIIPKGYKISTTSWLPRFAI